MPVLAAVDIGSNSVRLKIAKLSRSRLETLHQDREVTRLGEGAFRDGALSPRAIAATVKVLQRFRRACDKFRVTQVRVVATSATRDAHNAREFSEWVKRATGWTLEIISGLEEGRLIHLGVIANARVNVAATATRALFCDLGGGSCEITVAEEGHIRLVHSLPLGAVRLSQEFLRHDPPTAPELRRMHDFIREELERVAAPVLAKKVNLTIATSGTAAAINTATRALEGRGRRSNLVSRAAAFDLLDTLSMLDVQGRAELPGINPSRAQIIIPGAMVFAELLRAYDLPNFRYSPLGLRDGILAHMAGALDQQSRAFKRIAEERQDALAAMCRRYAVDLRYANHVRDLAQQLFAGLKRLHRLPPRHGQVLAAAAMLHECGYYVNRRGRHRHTWYLIVNSEIFGFDQRERNLIAAVARYIGKSHPNESDRPMRVLDPETRHAVLMLVALLRLARALNQSRKAAVTQVATIVGAKAVAVKVTLKTPRAGDLERWAFEKERGYFQFVFGRALTLR